MKPSNNRRCEIIAAILKCKPVCPYCNDEYTKDDFAKMRTPGLNVALNAIQKGEKYFTKTHEACKKLSKQQFCMKCHKPMQRATKSGMCKDCEDSIKNTLICECCRNSFDKRKSTIPEKVKRFCDTCIDNGNARAFKAKQKSSPREKELFDRLLTEDNKHLFNKIMFLFSYVHKAPIALGSKEFNQVAWKDTRFNTIEEKNYFFKEFLPHFITGCINKGISVEDAERFIKCMEHMSRRDAGFVCSVDKILESGKRLNFSPEKFPSVLKLFNNNKKLIETFFEILFNFTIDKKFDGKGEFLFFLLCKNAMAARNGDGQFYGVPYEVKCGEEKSFGRLLFDRNNYRNFTNTESAVKELKADLIKLIKDTVIKDVLTPKLEEIIKNIMEEINAATFKDLNTIQPNSGLYKKVTSMICQYFPNYSSEYAWRFILFAVGKQNAPSCIKQRFTCAILTPEDVECVFGMYCATYYMEVDNRNKPEWIIVGSETNFCYTIIPHEFCTNVSLKEITDFFGTINIHGPEINVGKDGKNDRNKNNAPGFSIKTNNSYI